MKTRVHSDRYALCLAPDAFIESSPETGLSTLRHPDGAIPLSDTAAVILKLCNGRNARADIVAHLRLRGLTDPLGAAQAFIDAACHRAWVVEVERPLRPRRVPVCLSD